MRILANGAFSDSKLAVLTSTLSTSTLIDRLATCGRVEQHLHDNNNNNNVGRLQTLVCTCHVQQNHSLRHDRLPGHACMIGVLSAVQADGCINADPFSRRIESPSTLAVRFVHRGEKLQRFLCCRTAVCRTSTYRQTTATTKICTSYHNISYQFLQGISIAYYAEPVLATVELLSVCLSVCLSHAGTVSKRRKLGSRSLHRRIVQRLES